MDGTFSRCWASEEAFLGLARDTSAENFAGGGLAALAVDPTVRLVVLPGNPSSRVVPAVKPSQLIPEVFTLPDGQPLSHHSAVRGTSTGYVGYTADGEGRLESFAAVHWHGGVDVFLGPNGGREWNYPGGAAVQVFFLGKILGWAWAAFELQRQMVERFEISGPFRAIVAVADTAGAMLGNLGAGWAEPGSVGPRGRLTAIEPRVLLLEDLDEWPDEKGALELVLRFGARLDLAFGGPGGRHLDGTSGPEQERFNPRW